MEEENTPRGNPGYLGRRPLFVGFPEAVAQKERRPYLRVEGFLKGRIMKKARVTTSRDSTKKGGDKEISPPTIPFT